MSATLMKWPVLTTCPVATVDTLYVVVLLFSVADAYKSFIQLPVKVLGEILCLV